MTSNSDAYRNTPWEVEAYPDRVDRNRSANDLEELYGECSCGRRSAFEPQSVSTLLCYRGHKIVEADNGETALELIHKARPDLVIADLLMPSMNGFEMVRRLRSDPNLADLKVTFCTTTYTGAIQHVCGSRLPSKAFFT